MTDLHQVMRTPGAVRELGAARAELGDGGVELCTQELRPAGIALRQQMQRLRADELPQRTFELRRRRRALLRLEAQPREQHVPHRLPGALVIGAHQAVADRVDARPGVPALDELPKLRAARVIVQRLLSSTLSSSVRQRARNTARSSSWIRSMSAGVMLPCKASRSSRIWPARAPRSYCAPSAATSPPMSCS